MAPTKRFQSALKDHTTYSQYAGDVDNSISRRADFNAGAPGAPKSEKAKLNWKDFKAQPYESKKDHSGQVEEIALENFHKHVNLANYIIEEP